MTVFRDDPYWQQFWENRTRKQKILTYSLAPFLDVAGILLCGASECWHSFGLRRKTELNQIAYDLFDRAKNLRGNGLGWARNTIPGSLSVPQHHRYYGGESFGVELSEATPILVAAATRLLFRIVPTMKKIEQEEFVNIGLRSLQGMIETLIESPCIGTYPEIPERAMRALGTHGTLLECEGLAYMQARVADSFDKRTGNTKRKQSALSVAELRKLADEIGMPFASVQEVFERAYSSWWKVSEGYKVRAQSEIDYFVEALVCTDEVGDVLRKVLPVRSLHMDDSPYCFAEETYIASEHVTKTFIAMFSSFEGMFGDAIEPIKHIAHTLKTATRR